MDDRMIQSTAKGPRPATEDALVMRLRMTLYGLRAVAFDAVGAPGIDYSRPRVQTSCVAPTGPMTLSGTSGHAFDPVFERFARMPDGLTRDALAWLRATGAIEVTARETRDLRAILDGARDAADITPVLRALALSIVAQRHVAEEKRVRWAKSKTGEGAMTWARSTLTDAVDAWDATGRR